MLTEYLERAISLEAMAANEPESDVQADLLKHAAA